jgi:SAM-dependent methyltransferase
MSTIVSAESGTRAYYAKHAHDFEKSTADLDLQQIYRPFLKLVKPGGDLLDAGCGSGRDTCAFRKMGFRVVAMDASPELAQLATLRTGQTCQVLTFQNMEFRQEFDGIWACASLLHVPRAELPDVLKRLFRALRPGGILYASMKRGEGEHVAKDGRFFSYFHMEDFKTIVNREGQFELVTTWLTQATDSSGKDWPWLNLLAKRPF